MISERAEGVARTCPGRAGDAYNRRMTESDAYFALTLTRFHEVTAFAHVAEPIMMRNEAANCLQLGLLTALRAGQYEEPFLATVNADGSDPLLTVMMTPPHRLILGEPDTERNAPALLAPLLEALPAGLPGVLGPVRLSEVFAEEYSRRHGVSFEQTMLERIYACEHVTAPPRVAGRMRRATQDDRDLLIEWWRAFRDEAMPNEPDRAERSIDRNLAAEVGGMWIWEDGNETVAMAGAHGPTPSGIRIGPVYTAPERRGRGFAAALVGQLTQHLLDEGRRYVFLFTDLANPEANRLYQGLGYQGVADRSMHDFTA